jgi:hypothetical protein
MKQRIIVLAFIIPFLLLDGLLLPVYILFWFATGTKLEPLFQQLVESYNNNDLD